MKENQRAADTRAKRWRRRGKFAVFCLLPAAVLLLAAEAIVRIAGIDRPQLFAPTLDGELADVHQTDEDLFWSLRPNSQIRFQGVEIVTNRLGLRGPQVGHKGSNEFRILSLGESTTFGAKVENEATYSARLEDYLNEMSGSRTFRVINAGVSAYSSFQSLKYLGLRGLELEPDMILFYHEFNDFLPSSVRQGEKGEAQLALTDRQLYDSRRHRWHRSLLGVSGIYRAATYYSARRQIAEAQTGDQTAVSNAYWRATGEGPGGGSGEVKLTWRVPAEERRVILDELLATCRQHEIRLVIIHPSYAFSRRHECDLTEFCNRNSVPLFEAHDSLHPNREETTLRFFADNIHPNRLGHERLARNLFQFLLERELIPNHRAAALM